MSTIDKMTYVSYAENGQVVLLFSQDFMKSHDITLRQNAKRDKKDPISHYKAQPELTLGAAFAEGGN